MVEVEVVAVEIVEVSADAGEEWGQVGVSDLCWKWGWMPVVVVVECEVDSV